METFLIEYGAGIDPIVHKMNGYAGVFGVTLRQTQYPPAWPR